MLNLFITFRDNHLKRVIACSKSQYTVHCYFCTNFGVFSSLSCAQIRKIIYVQFHPSDKIVTDYISGTKSKRPKLESAIEFAREGDSIVVWRLDRLGRNMKDLISVANRLNNQGGSFHNLQENITMEKSSSTSQLIFYLFAAFAEFEQYLILEKSAARVRGRFGGRPEKYTTEDINSIKMLVANGIPIKTIADQWKVSHTTIYRYLNKA